MNEHERDIISNSSIGGSVRIPFKAQALSNENGEDNSLPKANDIERNYRSDDTEEIVSTDNPTSPFPAPTPKLVSPRSPVPLHRQASPFPLESINSRRVNYQPVTDRLRTIG
ncbi:hypothetical protein HUJ04_005334, partial [Dendroctonus ponderosae]